MKTFDKLRIIVLGIIIFINGFIFIACLINPLPIHNLYILLISGLSFIILLSLVLWLYDINIKDEVQWIKYKITKKLSSKQLEDIIDTYDAVDAYRNNYYDSYDLNYISKRIISYKRKLKRYNKELELYFKSIYS